MYRRDLLEKVICYPIVNKECTNRRIVEARLLGIRDFIFSGKSEIRGVKILGKGTTSIVLKGIYLGNIQVTIKVRRTDANRPSVIREAKILEIINIHGVGPRMLSFSRNMIVWKYIEGLSFEEWLQSVPAKRVLKNILKDIIIQLYTLDKIGVSHNELSRPENHIIIALPEQKPYIIDFESATIKKDASNLTQFLNFLIKPRSKIGTKIKNILEIEVDRKYLINAFKMYKKTKNLNPILDILNLT